MVRTPIDDLVHSALRALPTTTQLNLTTRLSMGILQEALSPTSLVLPGKLSVLCTDHLVKCRRRLSCHLVQRRTIHQTILTIEHMMTYPLDRQPCFAISRQARPPSRTHPRRRRTRYTTPKLRPADKMLALLPRMRPLTSILLDAPRPCR